MLERSPAFIVRFKLLFVRSFEYLVKMFWYVSCSQLQPLNSHPDRSIHLHREVERKTDNTLLRNQQLDSGRSQTHKLYCVP